MKALYVLIFAVSFTLLPLPGSSTKGLSQRHMKTHLTKTTRQVLETLTIYNPSARQCDSTPLITASNARIDTSKLYHQEIRWMALSRDLLARWNGEFHYGDTVMVKAGDPAIDGLWVIQDNLNKRYKNRGDLLFDSRIRTLGKWNDVEITKFEVEEYDFFSENI